MAYEPKAGGGFRVSLEGEADVLRVFNDLMPSRQRTALRAAGNKSATLVKRTAKRTAPVGHGLMPAGRERKHLRDNLIHNTQTFRNGTVSTVVGADYRITPHMHLAHEGAKGFTLKIRYKRVLSNFATAPAGQARFFGTEVRIPQRKANRFLFNALEANKAAIEAVYADTIRSLVAKVMR